MATEKQVNAIYRLSKALGKSIDWKATRDLPQEQASAQIDAWLKEGGWQDLKEIPSQPVKVEVSFEHKQELTPPELGMIWKEYRADMRAGFKGEMSELIKDFQKWKSQYGGAQ